MAIKSRVIRWNYTVDLTDLDYMNIVGNAAWLLILQKARGDLLKQVGYPLERLFKEGIGGVVNEARVVYVRPGKFLDELTVETEVVDPFESGAILRHRVLNSEGKLMVRAHLTIVFVDALTNRGRPVPQEIYSNLFDEPKA